MRITSEGLEFRFKTLEIYFQDVLLTTYQIKKKCSAFEASEAGSSLNPLRPRPHENF